MIITGCSILYCSCTLDKNKDEFFLDKKIKSDAKILHIDTISFFKDLIYARDFLVYQDSILIVRNRKYTDVYFLELYNLKQNCLLKQMFRLGNGPNELLSANFYLNKNTLTIIDVIQDKAVFVNIDSVLQNPSYKVSPIRYFPYSPIAVQYKENQLLVENPNCFKDKKLGIDYKAPRFIIHNINDIYTDKNNYPYYTWNVTTSGQLITNYHKNRIIYGEANLPIVEIYDTNLNLLKKIQGPDNLQPNYRIISNEDGPNEILFKKGYIPYSYLSFCTGDNFFYLIYMGDYYLVGKKELEEYPLWIFQFDWDGNFKDSYSIGRFVSNISISADENSFYATAISEDKTPFLIKLSKK